MKNFAFKYKPKNRNLIIFSIKAKAINCNCAHFLDKRICIQIVGCCMLKHVELPGLIVKECFAIKKKKGRYPNAQKALERDAHSQSSQSD